MEPMDRYHIERIKSAKSISIVIDGGEGAEDGLTLIARRDQIDFKRLAHDIALAYQTSVNNRRNGRDILERREQGRTRDRYPRNFNRQ